MTRRLLCSIAAALLASLALAAPAFADRVQLLASDADAARARVELTLSAEKTLDASYFIIGADPLSLTSLSLLEDAALRGVRVRLLVDALWNGIPAALQDHLVEQGVEVREYHPFRVDRLSWTYKRMHDKLLIADGRDLVAGGRNVEAPYFGLGRQVKRRNYVDLDLRVQGKAASDAAAYFDALWSSRHVHVPPPRSTPAERQAVEEALAPLRHALRLRIAAGHTDPVRRQRVIREVGKVDFVHDPVGRKGRAPGVGHELVRLLDTAQHSAVIESPYLVPSRAFRRGLARALARGVKVRILTNSLASTDNLFPQSGYVGKKRGLVRDGVELWEYRGPDCLHAKAAVIDGETVIVGSFNLDPRSEFLNTEMALVVRHPELAADLTAVMDAHLENAVRIDERGWPAGASEPFPDVRPGKVLLLRLLQLLAPLVERQL